MSDALATDTIGKGARGDGGRFARQTSRFREWVTVGGSSGHYYETHGTINPSAIVPVGPVLELGAPHGREGLGS